jgi:hypothetical protein
MNTLLPDTSRFARVKKRSSPSCPRGTAALLSERTNADRSVNCTEPSSKEMQKRSHTIVMFSITRLDSVAALIAPCPWIMNTFAVVVLRIQRVERSYRLKTLLRLMGNDAFAV